MIYTVKSAGSELGMNTRTVHVFIITIMSGSVAGLSWMLVDVFYYRRKKMSLYGFCNGVIAGLVCITPACGFVDLPYSFVFGIIGIIFNFLNLFADKLLNIF